MCLLRSPCSKNTSWSSVWNMDLNFKGVISSTTLSRAGHLTAGPRLQIIMSRRGRRLVSFCLKRISKSAWWRCVRLMMNSLTCKSGRPSLPYMPNSSTTPQTSSPFVTVDVPHWSVFLQPREEVCQRLSRFLANADDHKNKEIVLDGLCGCLPPFTHFGHVLLCRFQGKLFDTMRLNWMTRVAGRSIHQGRRWWLRCH